MIDLNEALAKDRWIGRLASHLDGFEALLDGQGIRQNDCSAED